MECHACCAGGSHAVCVVVHARVRDRECDGRWACLCASVRRALARPKRNLVKVAPGYLRKRVKVASQRDRHKMVKVSEGAENIPPPYADITQPRLGAHRTRRPPSLLATARSPAGYSRTPHPGPTPRAGAKARPLERVRWRDLRYFMPDLRLVLQNQYYLYESPK